MEEQNPTNDLSKFGYREINIAEELLKAYKDNDKDKTEFLTGDKVQIWFNYNSGYVFLMDENYNVAMLDENSDLRDFFWCYNCGNEGFNHSNEFDAQDLCDTQGLCKECMEKEAKETIKTEA